MPELNIYPFTMLTLTVLPCRSSQPPQTGMTKRYNMLRNASFLSITKIYQHNTTSQPQNLTETQEHKHGRRSNLIQYSPYQNIRKRRTDKPNNPINQPIIGKMGSCLSKANTSKADNNVRPRAQPNLQAEKPSNVEVESKMLGKWDQLDVRGKNGGAGSKSKRLKLRGAAS